MKRLIIFLFFSILCFAQTDTTISGHVTITGINSLSKKHLISITVDPANQTVSIGTNVTYTATGIYSSGPPQNLTSIATWKSSNLSIATMTANIATCIGGGTTTISAKYSGITGTTNLTCNVVTFVSNDLYCSSNDTPTWGIADQVATLPQTCFYTNPSRFVTPGATRTITSDANWDSTWAATNCGDTILIQAGITLTARHTIPTKHCDNTHWIKLWSSDFASLPAYGTKISPCYAGVASLNGRPPFNCGAVANHMAKMQQPGFAEVLTISTNTQYLSIRGLEITRASGTGEVNEMIALQTGGVNHIVFWQNYIHGNDTGDETNKATIIDRTSYTAFVDNFISSIVCITHGACTDAHTIGGGTNTVATDQDNTWKIVNNYLEAAGENIILGGGGAAIIPSDLEIRHNYMFKPMWWNPTDSTYAPFPGGNSAIVKNCFELKTGSRILFEGNVCQNVWGGFTQPAKTTEESATNQGGNCPICATTNVTNRYSYLTTSGLGSGSTIRSGGGSNWATATNRLTYHDIIYDNLGNSDLFALQNGPQHAVTTNPNTPTSINVLHDIYFAHITTVLASTDTTTNGSVGVSGPKAGSSVGQMSNYTYKDSLFVKESSDGISNPLAGCSDVPQLNCNCGVSTPTAALNACFSSYSFTNNAIVANGGLVWPGTNCTSEPSLTSILVNYNSGVMLPGGDFHVKVTSPCHNTASDGTDPGANVDKVLNYISGYAF